MWLVTTTTLLVGLFTIGIESAAGNPYEVVLVERAEVETAPDAPLRPTVMYSGMEWSLSDVRVVPRSDEFGSRPLLVMEALTRNTTDRPLRVRESDLRIVDFDGIVHSVDRFDTGRSVSSFQVEPGEVAATTVVFKLQLTEDPVLEELVFQISEPGRVPALLPLVGSAIDSGFPVEGTISSEAAAIDDPDDADRQLVLRPGSAHVDLDFGPYRAAPDEQLTIIEVFVQRAAATPESGFFQPEFWTLEVDGREIQPSRVEQSQQVAANEDEVTLLFILHPDDNTDQMILTAGTDDSSTAFPISFSNES